jgi:hypothetical protein
MKAWIASLFLVAALSCPAVAQTAAEPTPGQLDAAREILKITNTEGMMRGSVTDQARLMTEQIQRAMPDVAPEALALFKRITLEETEKSIPRLLDASARIYARHFSEDDLRGLVAFYKTPLGSKLIAQLPEVSPECSQMSAELGGDMLVRFREELEKLKVRSAPEQKP